MVLRVTCLCRYVHTCCGTRRTYVVGCRNNVGPNKKGRPTTPARRNDNGQRKKGKERMEKGHERTNERTNERTIPHPLEKEAFFSRTAANFQDHLMPNHLFCSTGRQAGREGGKGEKICALAPTTLLYYSTLTHYYNGHSFLEQAGEGGGNKSFSNRKRNAGCSNSHKTYRY